MTLSQPFVVSLSNHERSHLDKLGGNGGGANHGQGSYGESGFVNGLHGFAGGLSPLLTKPPKARHRVRARQTAGPSGKAYMHMDRTVREPLDALIGHGNGWRGHSCISRHLFTLHKS